MATGRTMSLTKIVDDSGSMYNPWPKEYGEIRGGSQAMKIDDDNYLLFFHSSRDPPGTLHPTTFPTRDLTLILLLLPETGDVLKTYYMGAYTFSSKPPFAIKAITTIPITNEIMYKG